jgi:signal transduction histidine kinase
MNDLQRADDREVLAGLTGVFDAVADGLVIVDGGGLVVTVNSAAAALLGQPARALVGNPFELPFVAGRVVEIEVPKGDDPPVVVELRAATATLNTEEIIVVSMHDATVHSRTEAQLKAALRSREEFVVFAAHDLRSPIATASGLANLLATGWERLEEAQRAEVAEAIQRQVVRLQRLVEDLLDLARAERSPGVAAAERSTAGDFLRAALAGLVPPVDVEIVGDVDAEVFARPADVVRMLTNLVVNATKYGAPPLLARVEARGATVLLAVEDAGAGVPAEDEEHLFEPFWRAAGTVASGTGLGLAIVRELATANGAEVGYERSPAGGARFWVALPARA